MKYQFCIILIYIISSLNQNKAQCWSKVSAGTNHSAGIKHDGTLWVWGNNEAGQLGIGNYENKNIPTQINLEKKWWKISTGLYHSVALKKDSTLWVWGFNSRGQLGNGTTNSSLIPTQIEGKWKEIDAGATHTIAIKSDGTLWAWGTNERAQSGRSDGENQLTPLKISENNNWIAVSAGYYDGIALNNLGEIWAWGHAGNILDREKFSIPTLISEDKTWVSVSAGLGKTYAIKSDNTLWSWDSPSRDNENGEPNWNGRITQIGNDADWSKVSSGYNYALITKKNGSLWSIGQNSNGQLADGYIGTIAYSPQQIENNLNWKTAIAGDFHAFGINNSDELLVWGENSDGQLGLNNFENKTLPEKLTCPETRVICWDDIQMNFNFTMGLKEDGTLWVWGKNDNYAMGVEYNFQTLNPFQIIPNQTFNPHYS